MNIDINSYQAAMYFNVYMIKSVYFRCRMVNMNQQQEKELQRICKEPILIKLGLSRKFPRTVLCSRKSVLGVGLMLPSALIATLKLKLCIRNKRAENRIATLLSINEELQFIKNRINKTPIKVEIEQRYLIIIQIDNITKILSKR